MPVSTALKRLLRIRELEEDLSQAALESAVAEREHFQRKLQLAIDRKQAGRNLLSDSASAEQPADRHIALEEMHIGGRLADFAAAKLAKAEKQLTERRENYLATRTRRRQAETLIDRTQLEDAQTALRRKQLDLDEWFRSVSKNDNSKKEERS